MIRGSFDIIFVHIAQRGYEFCVKRFKNTCFTKMAITTVVVAIE